MIQLAAAAELWKRSANLRKVAYIALASIGLFTAGWISSWIHFKDSQNAAVVKSVVKQSNKNNATATKRTKEAVKVDRETELLRAQLASTRSELREAIEAATNSPECDLTDDELRLFNDLADSAGPKD